MLPLTVKSKKAIFYLDTNDCRNTVEEEPGSFWQQFLKNTSYSIIDYGHILLLDPFKVGQILISL